MLAGDKVGVAVGMKVGADVGATVGEAVGTAVGDMVGECVSPSFVGVAVGAGEHHIKFRLSIAMSPRMPPPRVAVTRK